MKGNITNINQLDLSATYTYADYLTWWFADRIELIKGKIVKMAPAPSATHQSIELSLSATLYNSLKLMPCKIFIAPYDVVLSRPNMPDTVVQPDICIICDSSKLSERGCKGAPDLIIEIVSPGSIVHDTSVKYNLYEECGVKEYWIVMPADKVVNKYLLNADTNIYELENSYDVTTTISSNIITEISIELNKIFL